MWLVPSDGCVDMGVSGRGRIEPNYATRPHGQHSRTWNSNDKAQTEAEADIFPWDPSEDKTNCGVSVHGPEEYGVQTGEAQIMYLPAPVVPPAREDESNVGDWWIEYSSPRIVTSTVVARESTNPRLFVGIS